MLKNKYEESKLSDVAVLVGAHMLYKETYSPEENFERYYHRKFYLKYKFQTTSNKRARAYLKSNGQKASNRIIKGFYRRNIRRSPKLKSVLSHYVIYMMDYVFEHDEVKKIFFHEIMNGCCFYSKDIKREDSYRDCLQILIGFQYNRLAEYIHNNYKEHCKASKTMERMKKCYDSLHSYDKLALFRSLCREQK